MKVLINVLLLWRIIWFDNGLLTRRGSFRIDAWFKCTRLVLWGIELVCSGRYSSFWLINWRQILAVICEIFEGNNTICRWTILNWTYSLLDLRFQSLGSTLFGICVLGSLRPGLHDLIEHGFGLVIRIKWSDKIRFPIQIEFLGSNHLIWKAILDCISMPSGSVHIWRGDAPVIIMVLLLRRWLGLSGLLIKSVFRIRAHWLWFLSWACGNC